MTETTFLTYTVCESDIDLTRAFRLLRLKANPFFSENNRKSVLTDLSGQDVRLIQVPGFNRLSKTSQKLHEETDGNVEHFPRIWVHFIEGLVKTLGDQMAAKAVREKITDSFQNWL